MSSALQQMILDQGIELRDMQDADLAAVLQIEQAAQMSPWGRLSFEEALTSDYVCRVLCCQRQVLAYHICSSVLDEVQILNVVVAPTAQGVGLGHRLLHDVLELAAARACNTLFLEVRLSNQKAQNLYRQWQFEQIAVRKHYYSTPHGDREDALIFVRRIVD
ncbi:ribosomal-protein-alanine acetyltransferase [Arenicella chitinivorans]|uniref:Ribosomal-protein-alanine acetyltransferase n=1 Tax=Arenicella chitinivorans TaxID=1329800 RepID=A0A918RGR2_9GAMM|nr:ribosomal protein S18-alanine N-acetyltransferase [Arenicella chitinivorans]GGZ98271.1 ribosomal-protein-alanine acetyltransferase [Arenicella chitinivorans]